MVSLRSPMEMLEVGVLRPEGGRFSGADGEPFVLGLPDMFPADR